MTNTELSMAVGKNMTALKLWWFLQCQSIHSIVKFQGGIIWCSSKVFQLNSNNKVLWNLINLNIWGTELSDTLFHDTNGFSLHLSMIDTSCNMLTLCPPPQISMTSTSLHIQVMKSIISTYPLSATVPLQEQPNNFRNGQITSETAK